MQVHQFYPTVTYGDAASNQILSLQRLLRRRGYQSEIFCERLPLLFEGRARQIGQYGRHSSSGNVLLLHFSLAYSPEVLSWLERLPDRKVLIYHNVTPHTYFAGLDERYLEAAQVGRKQLDRLRTLAPVGWGVSRFNCRELAERGWEEPEVLPIIFDPKRYAVRPDRKVLRAFQGDANLLFVGRVSPNKRFEDLILAFAYFKRFVRPDARLLLVGSTLRMELYHEYLQSLATRLGLSEVVFTGHVSASELVAYYRCADVYLSMSEHEGFGVPLLESMHFGLPVVAYKAAAVPETLGGCGVLVTAKDYSAVAELVGLLIEDGNLRARIVARQRERLRDFLPQAVDQRLGELLRRLEA